MIQELEQRVEWDQFHDLKDQYRPFLINKLMDRTGMDYENAAREYDRELTAWETNEFERALSRLPFIKAINLVVDLDEMPAESLKDYRVYATPVDGAAILSKECNQEAIK